MFKKQTLVLILAALCSNVFALNPPKSHKICGPNIKCLCGDKISKNGQCKGPTFLNERGFCECRFHRH
jgi:hypothetical protein